MRLGPWQAKCVCGGDSLSNLVLLWPSGTWLCLFLTSDFKILLCNLLCVHEACPKNRPFRGPSWFLSPPSMMSLF